MKQGFLSAMATIGYGLVATVVVLAVALGIMIGVKGIGPKDEEISGINSSAVTTDALAEEQDIFLGTDSSGIPTLNVSTTLDYSTREYTDEEQDRLAPVVKTVVTKKVDEETGEETFSKVIKMSIKGKVDGGDADYSSQKINVVLTKSTNYNDVVKKTETPVLFVSKNANGEEILTTSIQVQVNEEFSLKILTYNATNPYLTPSNTTTNSEDDEEEETSLEKEYILGGSVYLMSRSQSTSLKSSAMKIQVDVPVETLIITAQARNSNGDYVDVTDTVNNTAKLFSNVLKTNETATGSWDKTKLMKYEGNTTAELQKDEYYYYDSSSSQWKSVWSRSDVMAFIKNTEIKLGVKTFPENAIKSVAGMNKEAFLEYSASTLNPKTSENPGQYDADSLKLGIFKIYAEIDANTGNFPVEAKIPKLYKSGVKSDYRQSDYISAENIVFRVEPLKIESIEITNNLDFRKEGVDDKGVAVHTFSVDVYGTNEFSATDISSLIPSLDIKIKSKHFVWGEDPSQSEISNLLVYESATRNFDPTLIQGSFYKVFNITSEETFGTKIWTIENLRNYFRTSADANGLFEQIDLFFYVDSEFSEFAPYAHIVLKINETLPTSFEYAQKDKVKDKVEVGLIKEDAFYREVVLNREIVVDDDNNPIDEIKDSDTIFLDTTTSEKEFLSYMGVPTYKKWVYFAKPDIENRNEVGSKILNLTSTGQIAYTAENKSETYSQRIDVLGDGEVEIVAMLVLTDKNGNPVDCFYQPIVNSETTEYVFLNDITTDAFADMTTLQGKFVVVFCPTIEKGGETSVYYCTIDVVEELSSYALFYDDREGDDSKPEKFDDIATDLSNIYIPVYQDADKNKKTMFVVANSSLALENICNSVKMYQQTILDKPITYYYGVDDSKENSGKAVSNDSYESPRGYNFKIRFLPMNLTVLGSPKTDIDLLIDIKQNQSVYDEGDVPTLTVNFNVVNVKVSSINVDYEDEVNEGKTTIISSTGDKSYDFDTIKLKAEIENGKPVWTFNKTNTILSLNSQIDYTFNIEPDHDYMDIESSSAIIDCYNIVALDDYHLVNFALSPNGTYDKGDTKGVEFKIQVQPIYDGEENVTSLKFVLKSGWEKYLLEGESSFKNVALFYSVREKLKTNEIVAGQFFLLDLSDCLPGVVTNSQAITETMSFNDNASTNISYLNADAQALSIEANEVGKVVDYGKTVEEEFFTLTLSSEFVLGINLANNFIARENLDATKVFDSHSEFTVIVTLYEAENVSYVFEYKYQTQKNIYKVS